MVNDTKSGCFLFPGQAELWVNRELVTYLKGTEFERLVGGFCD